MRVEVRPKTEASKLGLAFVVNARGVDWRSCRQQVGAVGIDEYFANPAEGSDGSVNNTASSRTASRSFGLDQTTEELEGEGMYDDCRISGLSQAVGGNGDGECSTSRSFRTSVIGLRTVKRKADWTCGSGRPVIKNLCYAVTKESGHSETWCR